MIVVGQAEFDAEELTDFTGCELRDVIARNKRFWSALNQGAKFVRCDFSGSDFNGANFSEATFEDCTFADAYLGKTVWFEAKVLRCNFTGARAPRFELNGTLFEDCDMRDMEMTHAMLKDSHFRTCDLRGAVMFGARFDRTELYLCELPDPFTRDDGGVVIDPPPFNSRLLLPELIGRDLQPREDVMGQALTPAVNFLRDASSGEVSTLHETLRTAVGMRQPRAPDSKPFTDAERATFADLLRQSVYSDAGRSFVEQLIEVLRSPLDVFGLDIFVGRVARLHALAENTREMDSFALPDPD